MKSFYFLSLIISASIITTDSYGMLTTLSRRKTIYSPAQRSYCIKQRVLERQVESLKNQVGQHEKDLAQIKAMLTKLTNNNKPIENDQPNVCFIPEWNMYAPVREEKN